MPKSPLLKMLVGNILKLDNNFDIVAEISKLVCKPNNNKNLCVHAAQVLQKDRAQDDGCDTSGGTYHKGKAGAALATIIREQCNCPEGFIRDPGGNPRCTYLIYTDTLADKGDEKLVFVPCPFQCLAYNPDAAVEPVYPIDVVFIIDSTGSMQGQRDNLETLLDNFMKAVQELASRGATVTITYTIVEFGNQYSDYPEGSGRFPVIHSTYTSVDEVVRDYETIDFRAGGGTEPEGKTLVSGLEAILAGATVGFQTNSIRKMIYLSESTMKKDGDVYSWQARRNSIYCTLDEYDVAQTLIEAKITLTVVNDPADPFATVLARLTGGKIYSFGSPWWDADLDIMWKGIPIPEPLPWCPKDYNQPYPAIQYEYQSPNLAGCGTVCPPGWAFSNNQCVRATNTAQVQYCRPKLERRCDDKQDCCVWPSSNGYLPKTSGGSFYVIFNSPRTDTFFVKAAIKMSGSFYVDGTLICNCSDQWTYTTIDLTEGMHQAYITCSWDNSGGSFDLNPGFVAIRIMDGGENNIWTSCDGTVVPKACPNGYWYDQITGKCIAYKSFQPCTLDIVNDSLETWENLYIFEEGKQIELFVTEDPYKINTLEVWAKTTTPEANWVRGSRGHDIAFKIEFHDLHHQGVRDDVVNGTTTTYVYYQKATRYLGIPTPHFKDLKVLEDSNKIKNRPIIESFKVGGNGVYKSNTANIVIGPWSTDWQFSWETNYADTWNLWVELNSDRCFEHVLISDLNIYPLPDLGDYSKEQIKWYAVNLPQANKGSFTWFPGEKNWERRSGYAVLEILDKKTGLSAYRRIDMFFDYGCTCPPHTISLSNGVCHVYDVIDPIQEATVLNHVDIDVPFDDKTVWFADSDGNPLYDMNTKFVLIYELYINYTEIYTIGTRCSDVCEFWLDENLLMTNNEVHGWRMLKQNIPYGWHQITVVARNTSHIQSNWADWPAYFSIEIKSLRQEIVWNTRSTAGTIVTCQCNQKYRPQTVNSVLQCVLSSKEYCTSTEDCVQYLDDPKNQANGFFLVPTGLINDVTRETTKVLFLWNKRALPLEIENQLFWTNNGWHRFTSDTYLQGNPAVHKLLDRGKWPNNTELSTKIYFAPHLKQTNATYTAADYFIDYGAYENVLDGTGTSCMIRTNDPPENINEECFRYINGDENKQFRWTLVRDLTTNNDVLNPPGTKNANCPYSKIINVTCLTSDNCWPPWCQEMKDNAVWVSADGSTPYSVVMPNNVKFLCRMTITVDGRYYLHCSASEIGSFYLNSALVVSTTDSNVWYDQDIYLQAGYYDFTVVVENSGLVNSTFHKNNAGMAFIFQDANSNTLYSSRGSISSLTLPDCTGTPFIPTYRLHWNGVLAKPAEVINQTFFTTMGWCKFVPQNYKTINNLSATKDADLATFFINFGAYASTFITANHCISSIKLSSPNSCAIFSDDTYQFRMHYDGPVLTDVYTETGTEIVAPYAIVDGAILKTSMGTITFDVKKYVLANPDVNMLVQTGLGDPMPGDYARYTNEDAISHVNRIGAWDSGWGRCLDCPDYDLIDQGCYIDDPMNQKHGWSFEPNPNGYGMHLCYKGVKADPSLVDGTLFWTTRGQYEKFDKDEYAAINPDVRLCVKRGYTYVGFPLPLPSKDTVALCDPGTFTAVSDPASVTLADAPAPGSALPNLAGSGTSEPTPPATPAYSAATHFIDIGAYQGRYNRAFNRASGRNDDYAPASSTVTTPATPATVTPAPTTASPAPTPSTWPSVTPIVTVTPPQDNSNIHATVAPTNLPKPKSTFTWFSCGVSSMAAIADGELWTWGSNINGELGISSAITKILPVKVGTSNTWTEVEHGYSFVAALKIDGSLWTWGKNDYGQLGQGDHTDRATPTRVGLATNWKQISCGDKFMMAIKTDGTLWSWGWNYYGQLGHDYGDFTDVTSPKRIGGDSDWAFISVGASSCAAVKNDGTMWVWGNNYYGQLGMGDIDDSAIPIMIDEHDNWDTVTCGYSMMVAIKRNGTMWVCGRNDLGQLGLGHSNPVDELTLFGSITNWRAVSCSKMEDSVSTYAIREDDTMWVWGDNQFGQLGIGVNDTTSRYIPIEIDTTWEMVRAGGGFVAAMKSDESLWTWGQNDYGQLGQGDKVTYTVPTLAP